MAIPMRSPALSPTWRVPKPATSPARACSPMEASRLEIENRKTRVINKIMKALRIAIILGSTRPGRNGEAVTKWVHEIAKKRADAEFELVDIKDFNLPLLDEPMPPIMGQYSKPHTTAWAAKVASFDGYVFVTTDNDPGLRGG